MSSSEDVQDLLEILKTHRGNISLFLKQKAQFSNAYVPPHIINGIKEARLEVRRIKEILRGLGHLVQDNPADLDAWEWNNFDIEALASYDFAKAQKRYLSEMRRLYGSMKILGMSTSVPIDGIFTDIYMRDKLSAQQHYKITELQRHAANGFDISSYIGERQSGLKAVQQNRRLYILGKPGAGKTTFLKYLTLQAIARQFDAIPIFVILRDWADSKLPLLSFLARQFEICSFPEAELFIYYILDQGKAMVLFDGLDEVKTEQNARDGIIQSIREFTDRFGEIHCIITCRIAAVDYEFEHFKYCELADFTISQMGIFVTKWFQNEPEKGTAFLKEFSLQKHDRLRDLARTPLLLTLLCISFDEMMSFPIRRTEIYEEAIDILLKKWDASRKIRRDIIYKQLSLMHRRQMLAHIAIGTFSKNEMFMRQADLEQRIYIYMKRLPADEYSDSVDAEVVLKAIEAQHGLLVEQAHHIYSFSHLSIHEYFTARYIIEHPSEEIFREYTAHATELRWREVLLLTASMLDADNAESFFQCFIESLHTQIKSAKAMQALFVWTTQTAAATGTANFPTRLAYLCTALRMRLIPELAQTRSRAESIAHTLARASQFADNLANKLHNESISIRSLVDELADRLTRASNRANSIASDLNNAGERADPAFLGLVNERVSTSATALANELVDANILANELASANLKANVGDRAIELTQGLVSISDSVHELALLSAHVSTLAGALSQATIIMHPYHNKIAPKTQFNNDLRILAVLAQVQAMAKDTEDKLYNKPIRALFQLIMENHIFMHSEQKELYTTLKELGLPTDNAAKSAWRKFSADLREALIGRGYDSPQEYIDKSQYLALDKYFQVMGLLLQCLETAIVADRDGIRNRLLLPPSTTKSE